MNSSKIVDTRLKTGNLAIASPSRISLGKKEFSNPNALLMEEAYGNFGNMLGIGGVASPLVLVVDRDQLDEREVRGRIFDALQADTRSMIDTVSPERMGMLGMMLKLRATMVSGELDVSRQHPDANFALSVHPPFQTIFVFPPKTPKAGAINNLFEAMVDSHFATLNFVLGVDSASSRKEFIMSNSVLAVLESEPDLSDLKKLISEKCSSPYLAEKELKAMMLLRQFIHADPDNLLLLLGYIKDVAAYRAAMIDEFFDSGEMLAQRSGIIPMQSLEKALEELGLFKNGKPAKEALDALAKRAMPMFFPKMGDDVVIN